MTATSSPPRPSRDRNEHRLVGRQVVGEAARCVLGRPSVDARCDGTLGEVPTQAVVTVLAGRARGIDATRAAGEPGIQDDPLADLERGDGRTDLDHIGHDFVPEDRREGEEPVQRTVAEVVAEVHEDHLGVGAADAGQSRLGDAPVVAQELRSLELLQAHGGPGQAAHEAVGLVRRCPAVTADASRADLAFVRSSLLVEGAADEERQPQEDPRADGTAVAVLGGMGKPRVRTRKGSAGSPSRSRSRDGRGSRPSGR